jgi:hypothetical protein
LDFGILLNFCDFRDVGWEYQLFFYFLPRHSCEPIVLFKLEDAIIAQSVERVILN